VDPLATTSDVYQRLAKFTGPPVPAMRAWDGTTWGDADADATIVLRHPAALRSLLLPPKDLAAGEAYIFDDVDIEGDIVAALEWGARLAPMARRPLAAARVLRSVRRLPNPPRQAGARPTFRGRLHSPWRDRQAVSHHYDTGNDFFRQFLDSDLVYSCAYFLDPAEPLEAAQRRKLDVVCRKLELAPGMRFLDVGCGWGSLVIHAAATYGVEAVGITLSQEQAELARERVAEAGLSDHVTIRLADYRHLDEQFDAIASIGMVEHVGDRRLGVYFDRLFRLLTPGGQLLNHGITNRNRHRGRLLARPRPTFINTYVFPDGELLAVERIVRRAEEAGFELRDSESLRWSYALTLRHWVDNLEANRIAAVAAANEAKYRIWRMYMAGSAVAFERAAISVHQMLLSRPERPWRYGRRGLLAADDA
jgi:cyclopropane-fatty-acyl-phospholipid synthase